MKAEKAAMVGQDRHNPLNPPYLKGENKEKAYLEGEDKGKEWFPS